MITFQRIRAEEKEQVLELFKKTADRINKMHIDHWQYWKNPPQDKIKWVEQGIKNNEFFFINELGGENIGMVRIQTEDLLYWGKQKEEAKYVHSLIIKEAYSGKGFGAKVLHEIAAKAAKDNCIYLRLDSDSKNPKLCNYYEKMGFKKVGEKGLPLSIYNLYQKELF